jgi:hypothetical protein
MTKTIIVVNGQLKLLFDRIVPALMEESPQGIPVSLHRGKNAVIVTACTTPWPFSTLFGQTGKAVRSLKEILCYAGFHIAGTLILPGTIFLPGCSKKAGKTAERLQPAYRNQLRYCLFTSGYRLSSGIPIHFPVACYAPHSYTYIEEILQNVF